MGHFIKDFLLKIFLTEKKSQLFQNMPMRDEIFENFKNRKKSEN